LMRNMLMQAHAEACHSSLSSGSSAAPRQSMAKSKTGRRWSGALANGSARYVNGLPHG
jgi:hypothetical protein